MSHPTYFLVTGRVSQAVSCALILLGTCRFKQGHRIWQYQRKLKRMPTYTMSSKEMPVSQNHLFLGKGFLWTTQHTQRLRDLDWIIT